MRKYIGKATSVHPNNISHNGSLSKRERQRKKRLAKINKRRFRKALLETREPIVKRRKFAIDYYAQVLESNLPKSEQWFREMYLKEDIRRTFSEDLFKDQFNRPFNNKYIPDVCNIGYKYIIEIDGSIHNTPAQKIKDLKKDYYFKKREYLVIRVKYGDNAGYRDCIEKIKARITEVDLIEFERRKRL